MNIDRLGQRAIDAYVQKLPGMVEKGEQANSREVGKPEQDEVSISKEARDLQRAKRAVLSAPDVRQDKVDVIKKQIEEGTFKVSIDALVEKLLPVFGND